MSTFHLYKESGNAELPTIRLNEKIHDPRLYLPSKGLQNAVNTALSLGLPLLLTGEPGTGKTELASHIAYFFGLGTPLRFQAQTTSVARDLFYRYDALGHFQYSQTQQKSLSADEVEQKFIEFKALGDAIRSKKRVVVLIDEIDKAPRDLPNDVLAMLEDLRFTVHETGKTYPTADTKGEHKVLPEHRPIIIMTSNSEKNLPDAFLRRVVYYHINFPDAASLLRIVASKTDGFQEAALKAIVAHFNEIRAGRNIKMRKNPATAELIQWAALLKNMGFPAEKLADTDALSATERDMLSASYSVLAKSKDDLNTLIANLK